MQDKIQTALLNFKPTFLQVEDESFMHSVGENSHFKVVLVSAVFQGLRSVQRHQKVYAALGELMRQFHGLALHTYTPEEWSAVLITPGSPECQGGGLLNL